MLAVRLALAGHAVTVVEQGPHLEAIRKNGLKLVHHDGAEEIAPDLRAVASCADAGLQDLVLLALKAYTIAGIAPQMHALFGDDTMVVTLQNGLPWWYFQNSTGPYSGYRLKSVDPSGVIEQNIEARRIIGCVVTPGEIVAGRGEAARRRPVPGGRVGRNRERARHEGFGSTDRRALQGADPE